MIEPDGTNLGNVLYERKRDYICELGVCDQKKTILWNDIKDVRVSSFELMINAIPTGVEMTISITDFRDREISIDIKRSFFDLTGRKQRKMASTLMNFIISKIFDRQWNWLLTELRSNRRVSFNTFEITPHTLYNKKLFGGYDTIELNRIAGV